MIFGDKLSDMEAGLAAHCHERVLLGTDAKATPTPTAETTQTFASLAEAVRSSWYRNLMASIA